MTNSVKTGARHSWRAGWRRGYAVLSSMWFAIVLLCVLGIASVVGTVLPQHATPAEYVAAFGPLWAQVFQLLQLHAVYSAWWFILILAFLTLSTGLCVLRNAAPFIAGMQRYQAHIRLSSLQAMPWYSHHARPGSPLMLATQLSQALQHAGWRVRLQERRGPHRSGLPRQAGWMVAAKRGTSHRWGYLASHSAIVLIGLGGLIDSDFGLRMQAQWRGIAPAPDVSTLVDDPAPHRLGPNSLSFRGNVLAREGTPVDYAIVPTAGGYWQQPLPFSIELLQFDVAYYATGMPKMFASAVRIHDRASGTTETHHIAVNAPLRTHGMDIFQSGFGDGGSAVSLQPLALNKPHLANGSSPKPIQSHVGQQVALPPEWGAQLEVAQLNVMNVQDIQPAIRNPAAPAIPTYTEARAVNLLPPLSTALGPRTPVLNSPEWRNLGPSVAYRIRDAAGQAKEFHTYMQATDLGDGVPVFLWGASEGTQEDMTYLRIPQDVDDSLHDFLRLLHALQSPSARAAAALQYARQALPTASPSAQHTLAQTTERVLQLFAGALAPITRPELNALQTSGALPTRPRPSTGLAALAPLLQTQVPEAQQAEAAAMLRRLLDGSLLELLQHARAQEDLGPRDTHDARTQAFVQVAVTALSDMPLYPAPVVYTLTDFTPVQTSVLQVTKTPGRYGVYPGCALLIVGLCIMLFVRERRLWIWISPTTGTAALSPSTVAAAASQSTAVCDVRMAMSSNRLHQEGAREFAALEQLLRSTLPTAPAP